MIHFQGQKVDFKVWDLGQTLMKLQIIVVKRTDFRVDFKAQEIQGDE